MRSPQLRDATSPTGCALTATTALARLPALAPCLPEFSDIVPWPRRRGCRADAVVGWGQRPTTARARQWALRHQLPFIALEEGFVRSWGPAAEGYASHSLVVDHSGIYYDASAPSDLESLIEHGRISPEDELRASGLIARLRHSRLSKVNHAPDIPLPVSPRPRVLVVDQTRDDASIVGGLADRQRFHQMLDHALTRHPDADILVKVHPEVIAGRRQGHLEHAGRHPRCQLLADDINPWALFDAVQAVHVVTSQLGFEALLAGLPVTCHGLPFYAGWGLTTDHLRCPRRHRRASLPRLFAAAYLHYSRYANPYTGAPSTLEDTLDLLEDQQRQIDAGRGHWRCHGLSRWKQRFVGDFLGPKACVSHHLQGRFEPSPMATSTERQLLWGRQVPAATGVSRMEDGFLRSVGLGIDLVRPLSLVIDRCGIHYDPGRPSELERLIAHGRFSPRELARAAQLIQQLRQLKLSKYNPHHEPSRLPELPGDRPLLLVVGQVESDASVRLGAGRIRTNAQLLREVRRTRPDAFIVYRPHPDVVAGVRQGAQVSSDDWDRLVADVDITTLIDRVDEVHTMTSLTGFEALIRERRVVTYGMPFYAGWGLTQDHAPAPDRRGRKISLEQLVVAALIRYPRYVDPRSRQLINVETAVQLLASARQNQQELTLFQRLYRLTRRYLHGPY
ncbi:capsular polysaccharide biosynthesis protein [Halomonas sp. DP8Y7-1]|uniref:capsular polysaccharide biosynthesis protein n=1 Tax=Halomonas sp. DP8Y7-1 TaxID=2859078 RepID=UPI001C9451F5|nr:capsular polysaccharide biosynthesis protein [Halomonas sp. DP8Y7-1]MBY6028816.1 capsular polysaccharide biosynthesis protein [Halomonas sp. DP8Y7-1]